VGNPIAVTSTEVYAVICVFSFALKALLRPTGKTAVSTTLAIVEAFVKIRELSQTISAMTASADDSLKQKSLMEVQSKETSNQ